MLFLFKWGANRYAANVAFGCLVLSSCFPEHNFDNFSRKQIHLLHGDEDRSFVLGFGKTIRHALIIVVQIAEAIRNYVTGNIITLCIQIQNYSMVHWLLVRETAPVITKTAEQVTLAMRCHLTITLDFSPQLQVYCQSKNKVTVKKCKMNFHGIFQLIHVL